MLKKVAVTGSIASGKTTVCHLLDELGATVVNADKIVHSLLTPQTEIGQKVIQLLGPDIVKNNQIDRQQIADKVFNHPMVLRELENIIHPSVFQAIEKRQKEAEGSLFVVEIPLLFESGADEFFDMIVAVKANKRTRMQRFLSSGNKAKEFTRREKNQLEAAKKEQLADIVLSNDGTLNELKQSVETLYTKLTT